MGDRFRLIYLKSTAPEKPGFDPVSPSHTSHETTDLMQGPTPETFSSQTILKQVRADLNHPDSKVRILAIQYLQKSDPSIAIPFLQGVLSDQDASVRLQALSALIQFRDPAVTPLLLRKYLKDSDPRVKIAALRGMFRQKEKIDLNLLLQLMSDESPWVRRKAATLLGWIQTEGALPILMEMSKDPDSKVRKAALISLITLYPEEGEDRLVEAISDGDPDLRKWARDTLEKMLAKPLKRRKVPLA